MDRELLYNYTSGLLPKKYIWFRVAKNGTRSTLFTLRHNTFKFDDEYVFRQAVEEADYCNYFSFAFVRNPFERFMSGWTDKILLENKGGVKDPQVVRKGKDLAWFVDWLCDQDPYEINIHFRPQSLLVPNWVNFIGQMGNFANDLKYVCHKIFGLENVKVEHLNCSNACEFPFSNATLQSKVEDFYQLDFKRFDFGVSDVGQN